VANGGSVSGTVKMKGTPPAPAKLDVNKDTEVCGAGQKTSKELLVGPDGGRAVRGGVHPWDHQGEGVLERQGDPRSEGLRVRAAHRVGTGGRRCRHPELGRHPAQHPHLQREEPAAEPRPAEVQEDHDRDVQGTREGAAWRATCTAGCRAG
jgi:hypothetical protein